MAKTYKRDDYDYIIDGANINLSEDSELLNRAAFYGDVDKYIDYNQKILNDLRSKDISKMTKDELEYNRRDQEYFSDILAKADKYKGKKIEKRNTGSVYKVNSDIQLEEMLDYNKPIKDQSDIVRKIAEQVYGTDDVNNTLNKTGADLYKRLSQKVGSDKAASEILNTNGVKGIQYRHGLSESGSPVNNYVIFDTSKMNIVGRGAAKPAAMGLTAGLALGGNAIYEGLKTIPGDIADYAHDAANLGVGVLSTADLVGGLVAAPMAATGNIDAYNQNIAPYVDKANQSRTAPMQWVEKQIEDGIRNGLLYFDKMGNIAEIQR